MSRAHARVSNNLKARASLNAGTAKAWPVWKERLFGRSCVSLNSLGFRRLEWSDDMKRIEGTISAVVSPPSAFLPGVLKLWYLDRPVAGSTYIIDEELAGRILAGWSNSDLMADDPIEPRMLKRSSFASDSLMRRA